MAGQLDWSVFEEYIAYVRHHVAETFGTADVAHNDRVGAEIRHIVQERGLDLKDEATVLAVLLGAVLGVKALTKFQALSPNESVEDSILSTTLMFIGAMLDYIPEGVGR